MLFYVLVARQKKKKRAKDDTS
ncbi:hypothetical protein BG0166 [Borreliella bavariensis PBi]|uniref:Uncharacterized protein n=1 Tax=Borrelia garinii subsp. bavariensis (strain ATCC BAA-2496 / DSM 23469 / PBi) TaxID=290434 RepID=A0A7I6GVQ9_BORGP|nr:hypothetical protein BG0166 [Borreliella bavariensis PBi]